MSQTAVQQNKTTVELAVGNSSTLPGLNYRRLARLMNEAIAGCSLDLSNTTVLTEAASGAYAVTPVIAAAAGAKVYALLRGSSYGSPQEIARATGLLAREAGVEHAITFVTELEPAIVAQADIITNSGHLRPIDRAFVSLMKETAVIPLMYEAWEYREADLDLGACADHSIAVAGTNERHSSVDVFSFLGPMVVKLLLDAGIAVYRSRLLVLCDNDFAVFLLDTLRKMGAVVDIATALPVQGVDACDAVVVALRPQRHFVFGAAEAAVVATRWPGAVLAQFWGDVDRTAVADVGIALWPRVPPQLGHMSILPSAIGPEPIIRLQTGGLKVGEVLLRERLRGHSVPASVARVEELNWGSAVTQ